jgi:hypothetical protein
LPNNHQCRYRRVEESNVKNFQQRDENQRDNEKQKNSDATEGLPRFTRHEQSLLETNSD